ncbi:MAG: hypothetical protein HN411_06010 [Waddliaceae bacterium]|jgi:hypothetical protein|nr:hypothetical protein [Waddliaceae bacterium]MBT3578533.1 hypothetical protein [Waddliaceae bacterium]MBT4444678.1 hypothetical protein [Waddliaceae bacterium]MBT6928723.1 hypothetical protein [Waddliaceae bacterium]MBT7264955.1 hypothetical protein [Waddliaceae bacterium]
MLCWKCGIDFGEIPDGKVGFRLQCDGCGSWQHVCINCNHYRIGLPNDCVIPDTDPVIDREGSNFCEYFVLCGAGPSDSANIDDVATDLFGDGVSLKDPSSFNDFFKE